MRLYRGSTVIGSGSGTVDCLAGTSNMTASWETENLSACTKDTPGAGTHTYYLKVAGWGASSDLVYSNGSTSNAGTMGSGDCRGSSSLTLMEVKQ
jgi:hypothetical protein